jgi:hypothetical protein
MHERRDCNALGVHQRGGMNVNRTSGLEILAWPTLAWLSAWGVVPASAAAEPSRPQAPPRRGRKRGSSRKPRARQAAGPNVVKFPVERIRPLAPQSVLRGAAQVIQLRSA